MIKPKQMKLEKADTKKEVIAEVLTRVRRLMTKLEDHVYESPPAQKVRAAK